MNMHRKTNWLIGFELGNQDGGQQHILVSRCQQAIGAAVAVYCSTDLVSDFALQRDVTMAINTTLAFHTALQSFLFCLQPGTSVAV